MEKIHSVEGDWSWVVLLEKVWTKAVLRGVDWLRIIGCEGYSCGGVGAGSHLEGGYSSLVRKNGVTASQGWGKFDTHFGPILLRR